MRLCRRCRFAIRGLHARRRRHLRQHRYLELTAGPHFGDRRRWWYGRRGWRCGRLRCLGSLGSLRHFELRHLWRLRRLRSLRRLWCRRRLYRVPLAFHGMPFNRALSQILHGYRWRLHRGRSRWCRCRRRARRLGHLRHRRHRRSHRHYRRDLLRVIQYDGVLLHRIRNYGLPGRIDPRLPVARAHHAGLCLLRRRPVRLIGGHAIRATRRDRRRRRRRKRPHGEQIITVGQAPSVRPRISPARLCII